MKKNGSGLKRLRTLRGAAFRLSGPPSFRSWIDRALLSREKEIRLGDYTLILDQSFRQSATMEGGRVLLEVQPSGLRAEVALPVVDNRPLDDMPFSSMFDRIIAIDLGEKRIGYAVYSLRDLLEHGVVDPEKGSDGKPIVGSVAVPSLRRLMSAVRRHRGSRQPGQKVGQTFSTALMRFRENVVGDVCNRIDTLCDRHGAFPVLESSVANFESGAKQLETIYGTVLRRYTFSDVREGRTVPRPARFTLVFRNQAGKWLIVAHHSSAMP